MKRRAWLDWPCWVTTPGESIDFFLPLAISTPTARRDSYTFQHEPDIAITRH